MKIHHKILGLGISVTDLALITVWIPCHFLWDISVLLVFGQQFVILWRNGRSGLEWLAQHDRGAAGPGDGRGPRDGAVPGDQRVVLDTTKRVGRVKVVVVNAVLSFSTSLTTYSRKPY